MSFFPGQGPRRWRQIPVRRDQDGGRAAHRRPRRRLHGAARAAVGAVAHGRAVRVLRSFRADRVQVRQRPRRAAASAHRARHRHLSVRRRDHAPRQPRHRGADPARRGQLDDRRPRHRAFRAHRQRAPRQRRQPARPADVGGAAGGAGGDGAGLRALCRRANSRWSATTARPCASWSARPMAQRSPVKTTSETLFADVHLKAGSTPAARRRLRGARDLRARRRDRHRRRQVRRRPSAGVQARRPHHHPRA